MVKLWLELLEPELGQGKAMARATRTWARPGKCYG